MIELIKTEDQYRQALERVGELAQADPTPDSDAGRELGVLAVLVQDYERAAFPLSPANPIAAIRLRMDQLSLTNKDLIPFMGSRSKVSEVLAGKRPLSLAMIRSLHSGLRIPLESLVSEAAEDDLDSNVQWDRFPVREMIQRKWIEGAVIPPRARVSFALARELVESFLKPVGGLVGAGAVLHKTDRVRTGRTSDRFALAAWAAQVRRRAEQVKTRVPFDQADWNSERLRELRGLSRYDVGPRLAVQFLRDRGIIVIIEKHLKRTRLDGAAMLRLDGTPIIALTLRHDRVDNFWFTLFHELMHVLKHLASRFQSVDTAFFIDDLDVPPDAFPLEKEADDAAREALLPKVEFENSAANFVVAPATVSQLATHLGIADAIVAGRVRYEQKNYRLLASMVGSGQVQRLFELSDEDGGRTR